MCIDEELVVFGFCYLFGQGYGFGGGGGFVEQ